MCKIEASASDFWKQQLFLSSVLYLGNAYKRTTLLLLLLPVYLTVCLSEKANKRLRNYQKLPYQNIRYMRI